MPSRVLALFPAAILPFHRLQQHQSNKLENELRTRDQQYRDALEEQRRMEGNNAALRNEVEALRQGAKRRPISLRPPMASNASCWAGRPAASIWTTFRAMSF